LGVVPKDVRHATYFGRPCNGDTCRLEVWLSCHHHTRATEGFGKAASVFHDDLVVRRADSDDTLIAGNAVLLEPTHNSFDRPGVRLVAIDGAVAFVSAIAGGGKTIVYLDVHARKDSRTSTVESCRVGY